MFVTLIASLLFVLSVSQIPTPALALVATYQDCLAEIEKNPDSGFEVAIKWQSLGGGFPARHCAALALNALDLHDEAARRLEALAEDMAAAEPWQQAALLTQAANAWILWGAEDRAMMLLNTAVTVAPALPGAWIDRARLHMTANRPFEAVGDLTQALELAPGNVEALIFRGNAQRILGNSIEAKADLQSALSQDPDSEEAWLEMGNLAYDDGDTDRARNYWLKVRSLTQLGPVAEAAQRNIERMDVHIDGGHADTDTAPAAVLPRITGDIERTPKPSPSE